MQLSFLWQEAEDSIFGAGAQLEGKVLPDGVLCKVDNLSDPCSLRVGVSRISARGSSLMTSVHCLTVYITSLDPASLERTRKTATVQLP